MIFQSSALIGLGVIIVAWILQLAYSWSGRKEIKRRFLIFYAIGVALLVIDGYMNDLQDVAIFNLISLVLAMLVLIKLGPKIQGIAIKAKSRKKKR